MSLANPAFPASVAFDAINAGLKDDAERKKALKQGGAIFAFEVKNAAGEVGKWYVDLKETGTVAKGSAPDGKKADVTIAVAETDFDALVKGTANAQRLFMAGKLKVRGDVMKATRLGPIFEGARSKAKL